MHHVPVTVGSAWLDAIGLVEPEAFHKLIGSAPQVELICCGHVHHEFEGFLGRARVVATPSTGVQFVPLRRSSLWFTPSGPAIAWWNWTGAIAGRTWFACRPVPRRSE